MNSTSGTAVVFRPKPELLRNGIGGAFLAMVTLFVPLYLVSRTTNWWVGVFTANAVALLVMAFWITRYFTTSLSVTNDGVSLRTFPLRTRHLAMADLDRAVMAEVYIGATTDTHTQLAVLDARGRQLFRLRTRFWAREVLTRVSELIDAPVKTLTVPVSSADFVAEFRRNAAQHSREANAA